ncbi:MAG: alpha/beta hydrolase [Gammaproteobacteria bacterium]
MRKLILVISSSVVCGIVGVIVVGGVLAAPRQQEVGAPPIDLPAESVVISREGAQSISGWFVAGNSEQAGVLLLHSVRSNRREMIGRARFLHDAGYSVLLIDMQGHGETPGEHITFGYLESLDAHDALEYLQSRVFGRSVGVIGVSLGGAAALLGATPVQADALVLESVYSSFERAVQNRIAIRLGDFGRYLAPLLLWQVEPRLGIPLESLSPVAAIPRLAAPVMIIAGTDDRHTLSDESQELYSLAPEPKSLWMVKGARHQNLHRYAPQDYERRVLGFLDEHLQQGGIETASHRPAPWHDRDL